MEYGTFSVSLAVKDIAASRAFYERLGFTVYDGKQSEGWLILVKDGVNLGIFQGMFGKNILTFNPKDVRAIQKELLANGVELIEKVDEGDGPAYITLADPDGNPIMFDQHDPNYKPAPEVIE